MNLLMTQIEQRNVLHLTNALVKWPPGEISLFLMGVMSYMVKASPRNYENEDLDLPYVGEPMCLVHSLTPIDTGWKMCFSI